MNKSIISDCIKLCVITVIAGFLLGLVYNVTKAPIAAQEEKTKQDAYKAVLQMLLNSKRQILTRMQSKKCWMKKDWDKILLQRLQKQWIKMEKLLGMYFL